MELPWLDGIEQAKRQQKQPVVLTQAETRQMLEHLADTHALIGKLLYGSGLRLIEACRKQNTPACIANGGVVLAFGQPWPKQFS